MRVDLATCRDLQHVEQSVLTGLQFLQDLHDYSEVLGVLQGTLFQELLRLPCLPVQSRTSTTIAHSPMPFKPISALSCLYESFSENELCEMAQRAHELRRTVRVKIEDDNDLRLAKKALTECAVFLLSLGKVARKQCTDGFELLLQLCGSANKENLLRA